MSSSNETRTPFSRWIRRNVKPTDAHSTGLKVLAAGLWRCQTSSLQDAFEQLLSPPTLKPSMHGSVILTDIAKGKLALRAIQERNPTTRRKLVADLFRGFNASADLPGNLFVDDLLDLNPAAKVVLNTRTRGGAAGWARSTVWSLRFCRSWTYAVMCGLLPRCRLHWTTWRAIEELARDRFGPETDVWSARYYDLHNEWVKRVAKERGVEVLEWEPSMGWKPLCDFLGVDVPKVPFPSSNEGEEMRRLQWILVVVGSLSWAALFGVLYGIWIGGAWLMDRYSV
jgi:hypothetical protein